MIHPLNRYASRMRAMPAAACIALMLIAAPANASGSSMPWEAPLQSILQSIEGPVAKIIAVIVIIVTGLSLAFGDTSGDCQCPGRGLSGRYRARVWGKAMNPSPCFWRRNGSMLECRSWTNGPERR